MKKSLSIGVILLFLLSALAPIGLGLNVKTDMVIEPDTTESDGGLMDSAWPMFQQNEKHQGLSPYGKSGDIGVVKWKKGIGDISKSSPAIDKNGTIYIGTFDDDYLYAINPNGTLKWRFKIDAPCHQSSPAIDKNGVIYFGCDGSHLHAVYPNGTQKWRVGVGDGWVSSSPVIDDDGIIYVGVVGSSNICAVYPNGTRKWNYKTGGWVYCSPALDGNSVVYCGSNDDYMYAIYTTNGTLKWKYKTGDRVGCAPAIAEDGTIYFGSHDGYMYALNPDGTRKWRFLTVLHRALSSSPAIGEDGTIFFGCHAEYIFSVSPDGIENWRYPTNEEVSGSPVIDKNGVIYVGSWGGTFYALNPDGTARWKVNTDGEILSSPAIAEDGTIYISCWDRYLYAIEPTGSNNPPNKPIIDGPPEGSIRIEYTFYANATDPDGDNVSYFFDWGDGYNSDWTDFSIGGTLVNSSHIWYEADIFTIKVKAQDIYGADSEWATIKKNIPRTRAFYTSLLMNLLELFPILKEVIQRLIR